MAICLNQNFITPTHRKTLLRILPQLYRLDEDVEQVAHNIIVGENVQPSQAYLVWMRVDSHILYSCGYATPSKHVDLSKVLRNSIKQSAPSNPHIFDEDSDRCLHLTPTEWFDTMRYIAIHGDLYDVTDADGDFVVDSELFDKTIVFLRQTPKENAMSDVINEYLEENKVIYDSENYSYRDNAPRVECVDGFSMSVQVSKNHYCSPRSDDGPYEAVEIGFPSDVEPLILSYAETQVNPTETVYPYVPVEIVNQIIEKHGGLK